MILQGRTLRIGASRKDLICGQSARDLGAGIVGLTDRVTRAFARTRFRIRRERRLFSIEPEMRPLVPSPSSAAAITQDIEMFRSLEYMGATSGKQSFYESD